MTSVMVCPARGSSESGAQVCRAPRRPALDVFPRRGRFAGGLDVSENTPTTTVLRYVRNKARAGRVNDAAPGNGCDDRKRFIDGLGHFPSGDPTSTVEKAVKRQRAIRS